LQTSADTLESFCNSAACKLDAFLPGKPSLPRIQQLLFHIPTLSNDGNAKEAYNVLGEAVKVARDINLFLEDKWGDISEFNKEARRRTFWNLYVWDRSVFQNPPTFTTNVDFIQILLYFPGKMAIDSRPVVRR
jgi:hypothetical protein